MNIIFFVIVVLVLIIIVEIWNYGRVVQYIWMWIYDNNNDKERKCDTNIILEAFMTKFTF